jgi:preprotein translocase subunit YajC
MPDSGTTTDFSVMLFNLIPYGLMFLVLYLLMMRPLARQQKEQQKLQATLAKDDEIVTDSGFYGKIVSLDEKVAILEVSDKVRIRILRERIVGRWAVS